ncbi:MAG: hypothetical protein M3R50_00930 [Bacteroidota bacterium]|nr:hypothetical protein [Bacteroidota bacterium]
MKLKKYMIYILSLIAIVVITLMIGKINLSVRFVKEVKVLFSESKNISNQKFSYQQLEGLPEPVQQYFKHVLKEGQPYISYARLKHDGKFKTGLKKDWVNIKGEQYFTTEKPGFIWKGTTSMFVARDMYLANEGRLIATILSTINVVDVHGKQQYNESELLRWVAESVWFPTNFLPSERLQWMAIDDSSAKLTFNYNGLSLFYIVTFNDTGEIIQMETQRYMDEKRVETWICQMADYKTINEITIPTKAEVSWRLKEGDFSYARFNVKVIEYDKPQKF